LNASFVKGQAIYDPINKQITLPFAETSILVDGQNLMVRSFYVDAENGDDNNTGKSTSPFKTIKKAINSIPFGCYGTVYLKTNQTHEVKEIINITYKNVLLIAWGDLSNDNKPKIKQLTHSDDTYTYMYRLDVTHQSALNLKSVDFDIQPPEDGKNYNANLFNGQAILLQGGNVYLYDVSADLSNATGAALIMNSQYYSQPCITIVNGSYTLGDEYLVVNRYDTPIIYYQKYANISANTDATAQQVKNILKDSNGVVLNIISNINFE
jgi:hypothetical protein